MVQRFGFVEELGTAGEDVCEAVEVVFGVDLPGDGAPFARAEEVGQALFVGVEDLGWERGKVLDSFDLFWDWSWIGRECFEVESTPDLPHVDEERGTTHVRPLLCEPLPHASATN